MGPWGWLVPVVIGVCAGFRGWWGLCWDVCATSQRGLCGGRWSRGHRGLRWGIALTVNRVCAREAGLEFRRSWFGVNGVCAGLGAEWELAGSVWGRSLLGACFGGHCSL